jgi:hypothetical protein
MGLVLVIVVSLNTLWGLRLMGKGALFHYLERNHLENVMRIDSGLRLAESGGKLAEGVRRDDLIKYIDADIEIAGRADTEVFYVEQLIFRIMGFGDIFDVPKVNIIAHNKMRTALPNWR